MMNGGPAAHTVRSHHESAGPPSAERSTEMSTQDTTPRTRRVDSERGALLLILALVALTMVALFAMGA